MIECFDNGHKSEINIQIPSPLIFIDWSKIKKRWMNKQNFSQCTLWLLNLSANRAIIICSICMPSYI